MHWILYFIVRHRTGSSLFLTCLLSLLMLSSNQTQRQSIVRVLVVSVFYPIQYIVDLSAGIRNTFAENRKLRKENVELLTRVSLLEEMGRQNERLRDLAGFKKDFTYEIIPAQVVVRDPSHRARTVVINEGRGKDIREYMPVVGRNGVVGRIVQVLNNISMVQLIRDPTARTGAMVSRSRVISILKTDNGSRFYMQCRAHEDIQIGDTVITSGLGGVYPKGLKVGVITEIEKSSDPLFVRPQVEPFTDFSLLEEVFVIRLSPQWTAFQNELDSLAVLP